MKQWVVRSEVYLDNEYNTSWIFFLKKTIPGTSFMSQWKDGEHKFDRPPKRNVNVTRLTW